MILDSLSNASLYARISPRLAEGLEFLRAADLKALPVGRTDVAGPSVFALVQDYRTKAAEEGFWESHRRHIDIQYIVIGEEKLGHSPAENLRITEPFDEAKDLIKYAGAGGDLVTLRAGQFAVFFPHDAHMPGLHPDGSSPTPVRKVVVKVAV
jgi:YhcH/YjgK/YiaL family protein